ncbi:hypothetical protein CBQ26_15100 [Deinococcus indicus]|uniref:DNA 3'-5' helicase n=1 Tax=Deinococcus indicus TaxID=223556 RepID=A0A246BHC2_9DEIO|nr:UvrD-helicase domain-containing protein [Deinococcus indicus]OWL94619.1 hypothetical protein CBQ26_15100 [Deinococcus indicus]
MSLTDAQRAAAHAPGSVTVMAGAGSGKTHMLVSRYLHHLDTLSPLQVVATTFTEKAAAELRARIRRGVLASRPGDLDTLAELEAAQIGTIHALCARIVRDHPSAAGVRPDAAVLDAGQARVWRSRHLRAALAQLPTRTFRHLPFTRVAALLPALLDDPLLTRRAFDVGRGPWEDWAQRARTDAYVALTGDPAWQGAVATLHAHAGEAGDRIEDVRQRALTLLDDLAGPDPSGAAEALIALPLTGGSAKAWPGGALPLVKEAVKTLRAQLSSALDAGLLMLAPGSTDEWLAAALPDLEAAFTHVQEQLGELKRRAGLLDFADLEVQALRALDDPAVLAHYHARWQAYLIDEAQDTNPVQAELLERLAGPARRTLVGDEKQSIYGFRRADPALFRAAGKRITEAGGASVALDRSFRTHAGLVDVTNRIFGPLLGALHTPLQAERPSPGGVTAHAWHLSDTKPKARAQAAEAAHITAQVQALLALPESGLGRPLRPGDVAVLTRGWAALRPIGKALAAAGIPVHEAGTGSLLATQEARDGLALLAAASHHDPAALVAVLRSPLGGADDTAIWDLVRAASDSDLFTALAASSDPRLERSRTLMADLRRLARHEPPSALLRRADYLTGYTAVLANLWDAERRSADWRGFTDFVQDLERQHEDTFTVVQVLRETLDAGVDVPRPLLEAGDAVTLTTMHSSKGLEWPVVITANLDWSPPPETADLLLDADLGVGLRRDQQASVPWTLIAARRRAREDAEARRLLYVALTRARDHLILTAGAPPKRGSLLDLLVPGLSAAGVPLTERTAADATGEPAPPVDPPAAPPVSAYWTDPVHLGESLPTATTAAAPPTTAQSDADWAELLDLLDPTWTAWAAALASCGVPAPSDVHVDLPVAGRVSGHSALMLWRRAGGDVLLVDTAPPGTRALTVHLTDDPADVARRLHDLL